MSTETTENTQNLKRVIPTKYRTLHGPWLILTAVFPAISLLVGVWNTFHLDYFGLTFIDMAYLYVLVAIFLPLCFIWQPPSQSATKDTVPWYDIIIAVLSCGIPLYFFSKSIDIIYGWVVPDIAPFHAVILSGIMWAIALEAARRSVGWVFFAVLLFFSAYPLFGEFMPGLLQTKFLPPERLILFHFMGEMSFTGIPLHVFGQLFFGYMLFAIGLMACGIGDFFNQIAVALLGKTRGGNAKVAIVASGLFGSVSGHPGANIFATGVFTIPAMKREGFSPEFAGAVEACASSGGTLMPPVMGAVAFIMAQFLEIEYATVAIVAAVPSILYYTVLFAQIDAYAAKFNLKPVEAGITIPPIWKILFNNLHLILGFGTLLYMLFYLRLETWAPWVATAITFAAALVRKHTRLKFKDWINFLQDLGRTLGQMMGIMGPVGMMIGSLIITGIAYSLPYTVVRIAGGEILPLLLMGAVASFILGMGVSISACYIFLAIILVPGLVMQGIDPLAAHMFVLYCGLWSYITPPVCLSAFTAAIIAEGDAMKTGFEAMRLGVAKYILPFFFVLNPAMILQGPPLEILQVVSSAFVGLVILSGAMEGYIWYIGRIGWLSRVLFVAGGFLLGLPGMTTNLYGVAITIGMVLIILIVRKMLGPDRSDSIIDRFI